MDRRQFLKKIPKVASYTYVLLNGTILGNGVYDVVEFHSRSIPTYNDNSTILSDNEFNNSSNGVTEEKFNSEDSNSISKNTSEDEKNSPPNSTFELNSVLVNSKKYTFLGVSHTIDTFNFHIDEISDLIKKSNYIVSEYVFTDYTKEEGYFGQIARLCELHNKPIVNINNQSNTALMTEHTLGALGILASSYMVFEAGQATSRRKALKFLSFGGIGAYLGLSSLFMGAEMERYLPKGLAYEYSFNHTVDHRNVEMTHRLNNLNSLLEKNGFGNLTKGVPLVNLGAAHTRGIQHYLAHPNQLALKKKLYGATYGLIDNDAITISTFENNNWRHRILNQ